MWRPGWMRSHLQSLDENPSRSTSARDRLAALLALVTVGCLVVVFCFSKSTSFLMPGPLTSAHGGIEKCSACHTKSGSGNLSWTHGIIAGDPRADSKACLTCHKMPDTAFNPHGASRDVLTRSTERLTKVAAATPQPQSARTQTIAFPIHDVVASGLTCATCHQEHQGNNFKLAKISNEQCQSCHVVKFDSFDSNHPKFENYPFKQRTPIVYDHAGHFDKHYPEVAKKEPTKRIPTTCSTCHDSGKDKRVMAVVPFEKTCATCHLDQIIGKERVSGPKGIAFLTLPGLDVQSLNNKNAAIGEWPEASEATLTPFMKVMISRNEAGRALLKSVDKLNLQDLTNASDEQIKSVNALVWEIKALVHAMISGKASDVLGTLNISGAKLSAGLVADLTANIPRDVIVSAQQQWLPNLATEMSNRNGAANQADIDTNTHATQSNSPRSVPPVTPSESASRQAAPSDEPSDKTHSAQTPEQSSEAEDREVDPSDKPQSTDGNIAKSVKRDPKPCVVRVFGQCLVFKEQEDEAKSSEPLEAAEKIDPAPMKPNGKKEASPADNLAPAMRAGLHDLAKVAQAEAATGQTNTEPANAKPELGTGAPPVGAQPQGKSADQSDDLLFPTDAELRELKAVTKDADKSAQPETSVGKSKTVDALSNSETDTKSQSSVAPVINIASDIDPESWAEFGGWYRQDYTIFYRPTGHKDKFIYAWLFLTGPQGPRNDAGPAAAVFDYLTGKDAQGSCTKCHSVDDLKGKGRVVNFSPPSIESKRGSFTSFIHEPHFGIMENRGCLTCHNLEKGRPYLKSYEQGNPQSFASNFGAVKKDVCQTCHTSSKARQDCLTCHAYHVNGVNTPIMTTKLPTQ